MNPQKTGILLVNLGSPDSTSTADVRRYLAEFLMDKYVMDLPYILRWALIYGVILRTRPKKSAAAYKKIWWNTGSPLIEISKSVHQKLQEIIDYPIALGMRYGTPSIESSLSDLLKEHPDINNVSLIPLYPHYAMASTMTVIEKTKSVIKKNNWKVNLTSLESFYNHPDYIQTLANSIKPYINKKPDHILFSYHGIPERHVKKTDPTKNHCLKTPECCKTPCKDAQTYCYRHHVVKTTELVAKKLKLKKADYSISFQSRLGNDPWLQPFTDTVIEDLAKNGTKSLVVICPAFVSDCLETLEEIGMEAKETFLEHGGDSFTLVPCLNDSDEWITTLKKICDEQLNA